MQEASIVMWRKLDQLREESEFLPWAKVIVRLEALKVRRNFARDRHQFGDDVFHLLTADDFSSHEEMQAERRAMRHCLSKFEASHRELLLLPYRSHGAVIALAKESGKTENSLYKKIGRLREKLANCIENRLELFDTGKESL